MTNEEALKGLKEEVCDLHCHGFDGGCFDDCFAYLAIKALEKKIPHKDSRCIGKAKLRLCKCGIAYSQKTIKYCNNCGQAIDWSKDD